MKEWKLQTASGMTRILLENGCLAEIRRHLQATGLPAPAALVSNTILAPLYGRETASVLEVEDCIELEDGEWTKNWSSIEKLCREFLRRGIHRNSLVAALGGGVVTDLCGFAASIFMRGIGWIAVPTSLLAMVDASIGGKTGINLQEGKNLLGTFWPPRLVLIDPSVLRSLPEREYRSGLAEVLKAGWIADTELIDLVVQGHPGDGGEEMIRRAMEVKIRIVEEDEREAGARKALNLGHTLGHALESLGAYRDLLHGEAVAWGMRFVAVISRKRGLLGEDAFRLRMDSLDSLGRLPPISGFDPERVLDILARDKKRDSSGVAWVLPTDEGVRLDQRVGADEIRAFFSSLKG